MLAGKYFPFLLSCYTARPPLGNHKSAPDTLFSCSASRPYSFAVGFFSVGVRYTHLTVALQIPHNITSLMFLRSIDDGEPSNSLHLIALLAITMVTFPIDAHSYVETEDNNKTNKNWSKLS